MTRESASVVIVVVKYVDPAGEGEGLTKSKLKNSLWRAFSLNSTNNDVQKAMIDENLRRFRHFWYVYINIVDDELNLSSICRGKRSSNNNKERKGKEGMEKNKGYLENRWGNGEKKSIKKYSPPSSKTSIPHSEARHVYRRRADRDRCFEGHHLNRQEKILSGAPTTGRRSRQHDEVSKLRTSTVAKNFQVD
ncbi:hypothetical protein YC2023_084830 [Brassica napus]